MDLEPIPRVHLPLSSSTFPSFRSRVNSGPSLHLFSLPSPNHELRLRLRLRLMFVRSRSREFLPCGHVGEASLGDGFVARCGMTTILHSRPTCCCSLRPVLVRCCLGPRTEASYSLPPAPVATDKKQTDGRAPRQGPARCRGVRERFSLIEIK